MKVQHTGCPVVSCKSQNVKIKRRCVFIKNLIEGILLSHNKLTFLLLKPLCILLQECFCGAPLKSKEIWTKTRKFFIVFVIVSVLMRGTNLVIEIRYIPLLVCFCFLVLPDLGECVVSRIEFYFKIVFLVLSLLSKYWNKHGAIEVLILDA